MEFELKSFDANDKIFAFESDVNVKMFGARVVNIWHP